MLKKFLIGFIIIIGIASAVLYFTGNKYVFKALYYNFADIDDNEIFENRMIAASTNPQPWPLAANYNRRRLTPELDSINKSLETVAFLVLKNDSLVYEEYQDQYPAQALSNSFSMAKTMIGLMIGIAIEEGKIKSIDQHVGDFLPEFAKDGKEKITIKHLLTMSSGLDWKEGYSSPLSPTTEAYYGNDLAGLVLNLKMKEDPGKFFRYQSCDTQILAFLLEKATGKHISDYFHDKIWQPIGAENKAEWSLDKKDGMEKAYCCLFSNARDYARLGKLALHEGNWNSKQIVPHDYFQQSIIPSLNLTDEETDKPVDFYGFQWWLIPQYRGNNIIYYARGILGQYIVVIPEKNVVIVRLGKKRGQKVGQHLIEVYQMIDYGLTL